jgi:diguanylate cyclase (GGDEF)-like protein/PAS domain S-box-containing protein
MRARVVMALYGVSMLALTAAFYAFPAWHLVLWSSLALSSAGAIAAGVLWHRPGYRTPWWLLAIAVTVFAAGDTTYNVLTTLLGQPNPFPSLADVFYLAMYPIMATGLVLFIRHRTGGRDRGSLLDALSLTAALALLSWIFLIDPYVRNPDLTWLERATSIAYPLGDILILATIARLLITTRRNPAGALLGIGAACLLASDVVYGLVQLGGSWQIGSSYDLGWVVFYVSWGVAALHPSMVDLSVAVRQPPGEMSPRRVVLLMAVSLVAPAVLLVDTLAGDTRHGPMIAGASALLFLLVMLRLSGVVTRHRQAVERERTLRSAGAALVSAADTDDIARSVRRTVARLVPAGTRHHAAIVIHSADPIEQRSFAYVVQTEVSTLVPVEAVACIAADDAQGFAAALVCPLLLDEQPTARPSVGHLVVAAAESVLLTLQGALEVLASQAALAVERVTLTREVTRRNNEAYFRTLVQNARDVILIVDDDGYMRYASPSAEAVLGPGPVVGRHVFDLVDPVDLDAATTELAKVLAGSVGSASQDFALVRTDGGRIDVEVTSRDLRDDPTVRGVVLTVRDVTGERRLQRELTHRAFHDTLTGLPNRDLFRDRVEYALTNIRRRDGVVGILLVDLDDFKLVNDTMGHGAGDELLTAVATRLTDILRPHDTAARLGGDEFAILIEYADSTSDVEEIAARLVDALHAPLPVAGGITTSASVGVVSTRETRGAAEMLRNADLALYAAKEAGKGRWRHYEPGLHVAAIDRLEARTDLERAVATGAFELHYQPIVQLGGGDMVGMEALVRWQHPRRGVVPPAEFIHVAEETGLIVPLGAWVIERALADLSSWRQQSAPQTRISMNINVSACQVRTSGFLDTIVDGLTRWDIPAASLVLEITETALLTDDVQVAADLNALRKLGIRIAIDDFGTGYSSLDYIRRHTVDILKIDRSFIKGIDRSGRRAALIGSILHLARALELSVVAEGVETPAQRDTLLLSGCDLGQGYLFSVPVTADAITPWLPGAHPMPANTAHAGIRGVPRRLNSTHRTALAPTNSLFSPTEYPPTGEAAYDGR